MKRSRSIRLVLIGGLSAGALVGCSPVKQPPAVSADNVYTNNYFVPGVGYYHAPYRAFFALPYNHFDAQSRRYFYGGNWASTPCANITNISPPTTEVASLAETQRTDITRRGFGHTSHYRSSWS